MTTLRRITVDLTPLLPGGANGGAKLVARALVRELSQLAPETQFTLLTSLVGHADCADLEAPNVERTCVELEAPRGALFAARTATRLVINALVPSAMRTRLKDALWLRLKRQRRATVTRSTAATAELIFCPFTAPYFFDPRVPLVSLVHDLQYLDLPQFFGAPTRGDRHQNFLDACRLADRLICVSEFVRQSVLRHGGLPAERVQTVHSTVLHALSSPRDPAAASRVLANLGLARRPYLLYPANVWPHKNHARLVAAFAEYLRAHPDSDLALVCTGAPGLAVTDLLATARLHLPPERVVFAGYLAEAEFAALLYGCRALIFPSLYEGFGLPVLEAMAAGRPVLCSNTTSLPEIAGDAAVLFDPHDDSAIAAAIERLEGDPALAPDLVRRGRQRVAAFGTPREWAARYLTVFEEVVALRKAAPERLSPA